MYDVRVCPCSCARVRGVHAHVVCGHVCVTLETFQLSGVTILGGPAALGESRRQAGFPRLLLLLREACWPGEDAGGPIPAHSYVPHTRARIHRRVCTGTACDHTRAPHTQVCARTHVCNMCVHTFTSAFRRPWTQLAWDGPVCSLKILYGGGGHGVRALGRRGQRVAPNWTKVAFPGHTPRPARFPVHHVFQRG